MGFLISVSAFAQTVKPFSEDAAYLLDIAANCSKELADISESGMHVSTASHEKLEDRDVYSIDLIHYGFPGEVPHHAGTLVISRTFERIPNPAPDAPGGAFRFVCKLQ